MGDWNETVHRNQPLNTAQDVYRGESDREYLKDLNLLRLVTFGVSWIAFCPSKRLTVKQGQRPYAPVDHLRDAGSDAG